MVNSKISRIAKLGGKIESVNVAAETIGAAQASILAYDPVMDIVPAQFQRNPVGKHMSKLASEPGARAVNINFKAELMGPASGSKGTTLPITPYLQMAGMSEALLAATSNTFSLISSGFSTGTIKKFEDGFYKTALGCALNAKFQFKVGEPVMIEFTGQGKYSDHGDIAMLSPTYPDQIPLMFFGATVDIFGDTLVLDNLEIDLQNEIVLSPLPSDVSGIDYAKIVDRRPIMTFDPELVAKASHDFYGKLLLRTTASVAIRINDANGNMMEISLPAVRYTGIGEGDRQGIKALNATCEILTADFDTGNDEMTLVFGTSSSSSSSSSSQSSSSSSSSSD